VFSPDGRALYDVNPRPPERRMTMVPQVGHETYAVGPAPVATVMLFADTVHLGAQYGGFILDVALSTSAPGALVAGGVPRSRLLVLLGLLVLMGGLVGVAVLQLRREHELARLRAEFTAGVSHELRTPLSQILLYGETLMLERTRSERERRAATEVIVREARRLMHLVENALHFARHDRRSIRPAPEQIALGALTREILLSFAPLAWSAQVKLREEVGDATAIVDAAAFRQILLNLLDNAVKYGPAGQTVLVGLERQLDTVRLTVEDEGPGVAPADRQRIWAPFVRLPSPRNRVAGSGIGLAVVNDLVAQHGGRTWVEEGARGGGGGARFVVELPTGGAKNMRHRDGPPPVSAAL
jgi:signal transduction histidine kinase